MNIRTTHGISPHYIDFQELKPGDNFDDVLRERIAAAHCYVFLVSENFLQSDYVQKKEWKWIREKSHTAPVCCIEIGKAFGKLEVNTENDFLVFLKEIHWDTGASLPLRLPKSPKEHVEKVRRSIKGRPRHPSARR